MKVKDAIQWLLKAPLNADFVIGSVSDGWDRVVCFEPNSLLEFADGSVGLIYDPNKKEDGN